MTRPLILFAHGAGVPSASPWMRAWAARLQAIGDVLSFDYPYMREGRKSPDRHDKLVAAHAEALQEARSGHPDAPVVLAGKSMGSRIGCHLALEPEASAVVRGLVCLGYPLVGGKNVRDEVLVALRTPILFVQGTRDRMCPLDTLEQVRDRMKARSELHVVESGDHSLKATATSLKQRGMTQDDSDGQAIAAIAAFCASVAG